MKNYLLMILKAGRAFKFVLLAAFSLLLFSCSTEETNTMDEPTVYDLLTNTNSKARSGNVAPGDDPIALIAINGGFDELVAALSFVDAELNAGLVNLFLNGKDQYTVFAPTNAAFYELYDTLGVEGVEELDASLVLNVLLYHVAEGRRGSNSVVPPRQTRSIETLLGTSFMVDKDANIQAIGNTANFEAIDISASNGIIHVIDSVLLPIELN
ncbi:fasciclin domain-containing protein [Antarcticibacterium arcticum]|uniref:Fasciclin domain-containing protein n=1 Tax=Antarcticibacterium arcticum TaxID=2585771 RepID=A0A5B8YNJ3_9FLAO|nr:fasciclin domain-containing protein [Antarcticibacterium arcticum]QED38417.1 fasciclin domain-containing protein [Antarcticibacterium arcticum]